MGRQALQHLGYEVITETSSLEALALFTRHPDRFDLVITDMTMPQMTGKKLAQEMLRMRPDIPIILCTGFSEHINEEEARALGLGAFLLKPFALRDLAQTVRTLLNDRSNRLSGPTPYK